MSQPLRRITRVYKEDVDSGIHELEQLIVLLRSRGVILTPFSRLNRHLAALKRWDKSAPASSRFLRSLRLVRVGRAAIDAREFKDIAEQLSHDFHKWSQRAQEAVGGQDLPHQELKTKSRDRQFELFLVASFRRAGILAQPFPEPISASKRPDLLITINRFEIPVEAKRVGSTGALVKRFGEALRQLEACKRPGLIAVEVSKLLQANEPAPVNDNFFGMGSISYNRLIELEATMKGEITKLAKSSFVLGVVWRASLLSQHPQMELPQVNSSFLVSPISGQMERMSPIWTLANRLSNRDRQAPSVQFLE